MSRPTYILAARPSESRPIPAFFESGRGTVKELLSDPPVFRSSGWDLQTADTPRIIDGEYWGVANGDRKTFHLYEDGTFLSTVLADQEFLGWGRRGKDFEESPHLNPLALIEFTTCYVYFYAAVLERFETLPKSISFHIEMRNAKTGQAKLFMTPYGLNSGAWQFRSPQYEISKENVSKSIDVESAEVIQDRDAVAYRIVEKVYLFFSIPTNEIPYTKGQAPKRIDTAQFNQ